MIIHLFNSGSVSGPEKLVLPALTKLDSVKVVFLVEKRLEERGLKAYEYAVSLGLECERVDVESRFDFNAISKLCLLYTSDAADE